MAITHDESAISVSYRGRYAVVTIDNDKKLNALSQAQYYDLGRRLEEVATHDEVYVTILTGRGRYFSAGADVTAITTSPDAAPSGPASHALHLQSFAALNLSLTRSFYTHPKILVVGLNGPAIGLSAALVALADVVYCSPSAFILTPFSSLGLVAEGASSRALVRRLGPARAADALLMSRRVTAPDLERCGFVNKILSADNWEATLMAEVEERLGPHLSGDSLLGIKKLMKLDETAALERHNTAEVFAGVERFMAGVPQGEFVKVASGEKRHKL